MAYRYKRDDYSFEKAASSLAGLYALYLFSLWFTNKPKFYEWMIYNVLILIALVAGIAAWKEYQSRKKKKKLSDLLISVRQTGAEEYLSNFINSFGYQKKIGRNLWRYEEYSFTWQQLDILRKALHDRRVPISVGNYKDINLLLSHYIYHKNEGFIHDSIGHQPKTFNTLTGTTFEDLLYRLYTAMGYSVMKTGKTGDQGCDLIVNMGEQRSVVQAKCYNGSVPNAAIQQAVGALKLYNCTKAFVVTNSYFTPEAIQLAKVNNVGLVGGERLREMLLQYLKENWN